MNLRQVIYRENISIIDDFPVFTHLEDVVNLTHFVLTPELVVHCEINYSKFNLTDVSVFYRMISVRRLLLPYNHIQKVYDSMFASMAQLMLLDLSHNHIKYLPPITLRFLHNLQYIALHHNLIVELPERIFVTNPDVHVLSLECNKVEATISGHRCCIPFIVSAVL